MDIVKYEPLTDPELIARLHTLQNDAVKVLEPHVLRPDRFTLAEFTAMVSSPSVHTWVGYSDGVPHGLLLMNTDLATSHWVSDHWVRHNYPAEHADGGRVWFIEYAAVDPAHQKSMVLAEITKAIAQEAALVRAVVLMDVPRVHQPSDSEGLAQGSLWMSEERAPATKLVMHDVVRWFALEVGPLEADPIEFFRGELDGSYSERVHTTTGVELPT